MLLLLKSPFSSARNNLPDIVHPKTQRGRGQTIEKIGESNTRPDPHLRWCGEFRGLLRRHLRFLSIGRVALCVKSSKIVVQYRPKRESSDREPDRFFEPKLEQNVGWVRGTGW